MKYFTIVELCKTNKNIENSPNPQQIENLTYLVDLILDNAREKLGKPITISSGFRSQAVNKAVGGVSSSQHTKGEAADLICSDNKKLFEIIKEQGKFDQLIWEYGDAKQPSWVHVSVTKYSRNRHEVLRCKRINGKTKYEKI